MKILFFTPPLVRIIDSKGYPTLTGNRQFQYFKYPTNIYPLLSAQLATRFHLEGHKVDWCDYMAGDDPVNLHNYDKVYVEVKAPVYDRIRYMLSDYDNIIYYGDHVKYLGIDPIDYSDLPFEINRDLTHWWLYAYNNGNYKYTPGTYIQSARDCWYSKCTFCSWPANLYHDYQCRTVEDVVNEIELLVYRYRIREIMDDSGTLPVNGWLIPLCHQIVKSKIKATLDCNMRFGALEEYHYIAMKHAGFRMLLFGLESANEKTLKLLNKGISIEQVVNDCMQASRAGLEPHITVMFGYPWETEKEADNTIEFVKYLLSKGYASSVQASLIIPYPGTPLFNEAKKQGWLLTEDFSRYDQTEPILRCSYNPIEKIKQAYSLIKQPAYIWQKLKKLRTPSDIRYYWRGIRRTIPKL